VTLNWHTDFCSEEDAKVKELLYVVEKRIPQAMGPGDYPIRTQFFICTTGINPELANTTPLEIV